MTFKVSQYGAIEGSLNNDPLCIEVAKTLRQRPISLFASWYPDAGAAATDLEAAGRVIVYRGTFPEANAFAIEPFTDLSQLGVRIIFDAFVTYRTPISWDFTKWPNDVVKVEPNEPLGAILFHPHDQVGLGADVRALGTLVFVGTESPDEDESDVRRIKVK